MPRPAGERGVGAMAERPLGLPPDTRGPAVRIGDPIKERFTNCL